jgi:hypothetical protein
VTLLDPGRWGLDRAGQLHRAGREGLTLSAGHVAPLAMSRRSMDWMNSGRCGYAISRSSLLEEIEQAIVREALLDDLKCLTHCHKVLAVSQAGADAERGRVLVGFVRRLPDLLWSAHRRSFRSQPPSEETSHAGIWNENIVLYCNSRTYGIKTHYQSK